MCVLESVDNSVCRSHFLKNGHMTRPKDLPVQLRVGAFTRQQLQQEGFSGQRVRRKDISQTPVRGLYFFEDIPLEEEHVLRGLQRIYSNSWASHFSAARFHKLAAPPHELAALVHLSTPKEQTKIRRKGVVSYQPSDSSGLTSWRGIRISRPYRTVMELARIAKIDDLVIMIDQLIREPRPEIERNWSPICPLSEWNERLGLWRGYGKKKLVEATKLARVGSDSPPETRLRLSIVRAGLPEPTLQIELPVRGWPRPSADLGYEDLKIAVHYDGATHRTAKQQGSDNWRDNAFASQGWRNLRCSAADLANEFTNTCRQLRILIQEQREALCLPSKKL